MQADAQGRMNNNDTDHPLARELHSLRSALAHYQHLSHTSQVQIQRHSLEATFAIERAKSLEQENLRLLEEISILRAHPDVTPNAASLQASELTLALRRVSDKLTQTEATLLAKTTELTHALSAKTRSQKECLSLHESLRTSAAKLDQARRSERDHLIKARVAQQEVKMVNFALQEYADLVRALEGRPHGAVAAQDSSAREGLAQGVSELHQLSREFNDNLSRSEAEIARLQSELESTQTLLDIERQSGEEEQTKLAHAEAELERYKTDDNSAPVRNGFC
ncbi:hypothetical protein BOTBODRAFT_396957 [Botryobasidium botryosum FD-172 SS1]|uniref:Uncharacterized protein n=1 Tax=Botryobasidium botryosum (strain FD-172 SS1) TaxID=930990 RepID=A0A067MEM3_BOTB1|nr:hypothetical protein BOTBODRAFT_396957 [Botryobasidium botryosum FD-172 SS1]